MNNPTKSFFSCVLLALLVCQFGEAAKKRPNIVFILADDLGVMDMTNEGSTFHETPNIDRIANEGMKFTQGYATCQVCSPSRASILTGTYPPKHGITSWIGDPSGQKWKESQSKSRNGNRYTKVLPPEYVWDLAESEITLPEVLRDAGYKTFFAGKWHLGYEETSDPENNGFEINRGGWGVGSPRGGFFAPWENPKLESGPDGESLSIRLGQETADFIENNKDDGPFLAYLSFYAVHGPIQTTKELWGKYRDKAEKMGLAESRFIWDRNLPVRQVQDCPIYAGMMESMDTAVGIVLDKLDELGLAENTIVCFTSDHGGVSSGDAYATSNLPLRGGKGRQWEGGLRVPYYVRAPGIASPGSVSDTPVSGVDWYPTLVKLGGAKVPKKQAVDGVDFTKVLKGGKIADRALYWHYPHYGNQGGEPSSVISQDGWKLVHYHEDGRDELYQFSKDIGETTDLAASQPERAQLMRKELDEWLESVDAKMPTVDPDFSPEKRKEREEYLMTEWMRKLEAQHANFLSEDYEGPDNWWGSDVEGK